MIIDKNKVKIVNMFKIILIKKKDLNEIWFY